MIHRHHVIYTSAVAVLAQTVGSNHGEQDTVADASLPHKSTNKVTKTN